MSIRSRRRVGLVGSSGGGAATLGHLSPTSIVLQLRRELSQCDCELVSVVLVVSPTPLDYAAPDSPAELYALGLDGSLQVLATGTLEAINNLVRAVDRSLATETGQSASREPSLEQALLELQLNAPAVQAIDALPAWCSLDGLVSISSSPTDVNKCVFESLAGLGLPVVATGGTSVGQMAAAGVNVVGASGGSVATTPASKAIVAAAR